VTAEEVLHQAGLPEAAFRTLPIGSAQVARVIAHPAVRAVAVTGSERAGSAVAATAGQYIKKTVLELGGSDAFIVLADCDVSAAARSAAQARYQNCGQSCIAAKRFIVLAQVADQFEAELAAAADRLPAAALKEPGCSPAATVQPPTSSTGATAEETRPHHGTPRTTTTVSSSGPEPPGRHPVPCLAGQRPRSMARAAAAGRPLRRSGWG
jgi:acyl-CoA reductase-like NAD-dependent aldehyde dehydrogenase